MEELLKLTAWWYKYINMDHHKDSDCHFMIEQTFSYGDKPKWKASHYGYIGSFEHVVGSYEEAVEKLTEGLKEMIREEQVWAREVLKGNDWAEDQIARAKEALSIEV